MHPQDHPAWWGDDSSVPPATCPATMDGSVNETFNDPDVRHTRSEPCPLDGPPVPTLYHGQRPFSSWPSRPDPAFASRGESLVVAIMRRWPVSSIFKAFASRGESLLVAIMRRWPLSSTFKIRARAIRPSRDAAANLARRAGSEAWYYLAADVRRSLGFWARLAARLVWAAAVCHVVVVQASIMACLTMALLGCCMPLLGCCMAIRACAIARLAADRTAKGV